MLKNKHISREEHTSTVYLKVWEPEELLGEVDQCQYLGFWVVSVEHVALLKGSPPLPEQQRDESLKKVHFPSCG